MPYKKIIEDVFDDIEERYLEYLNSEDLEKSFEHLKDKDVLSIILEFISKSRSDSVEIAKAALIKLFNSKEFRQELFKDMMKQEEKEKKRTGENG